MGNFETESIEGFVQRIAVDFVARGFFFYVLGTIPEKKNPCDVDLKLDRLYGLSASRFTRARRKAEGRANIRYVRFDRTYLLAISHGTHEIWEREGKSIRDSRKQPIVIFDYSISHKKGHASVRIERERFRELKAYFEERAVRSGAEAIERGLRYLPFEPYAPIRVQLHEILRAVNRKRKASGLDLVPSKAIRSFRPQIRLFKNDTDVVSDKHRRDTNFRKIILSG